MGVLVLEIVAAIIIARLLFLVRDIVIRALARIPFKWASVDANTFTLVTTQKEMAVKSTGNIRGGNVVDVIHAIPGRVLVRDSTDLMDWHFEKGFEPDHDTYFYQVLGVQDMGSIFYKLQTNVDKRNRYTRDDNTPDLKTVFKELKTEYIFFSGEIEVPVKEADTADRIGVNFKINFIFERKFPYRSVKRVADAPAFLASYVETIVNGETSSRPVEAYYGGPETKVNRELLAKAIYDNEEFKKVILDQLGLEITGVAIHDVDVNDGYKAILAQKLTAVKAAEAKTIEVDNQAENTIKLANADSEAKKLRNKADADWVESVLVPATQTPGATTLAVADRYGRALETSKLTTLAIGTGTALPLLPTSAPPESKDKAA